MSSTDGVTVEYKPDENDVEAGRAEIKSPAKNRFKGTVVNAGSGEEKSRRIPVMFERSSKSFWNPKFDTKILEDQHTLSSFPQARRRFQYALGYITILCVIWAIYFGLSQLTNWVAFVTGVCVLFAIVVAILIFTFTTAYQKLMIHTSIALSILLCLFGLLSFVYDDPDMSAVGTFTGSIEILLMMYTVIPLPLYISVLIGVLYSVTYEVLSALKTDMNDPSWIIARVLLHICIHLVGIHIFIMGQVRKRSTFLKVGQSIMSRRDLALEKALKQKMIYSLMPQKVANEVMQTKDKDENKDEASRGSGPRGSAGRGSSTPDDSQKITFRTFHMSQLDSVSILFADIVGFTKMSSNKTAEHLVSLLNDLFGRFDVICTESGCEKISTLGDCYYCVSGCPTARDDHAKCCVEMGIRMCTAIKEFDEDHDEAVNMRVGVHTGAVLCGLVGTRRFKFDVWSHDVTLANTMESEGKPGLVHVSHPTYMFIKDMYVVEPGEEVEDIRKHKVLIEHYDTQTQQYAIRHVQDEAIILTYFITGKKMPNGEIINLTTNDVKPHEKPAVESVGADGVKIAMETDRKEDERQARTDNNNSPKAHSNHKVLPVLGQEVDVAVEVESDASSAENEDTVNFSNQQDADGPTSESQTLLPPCNNHDNNHNNTTTTSSPIKVFKPGDISQLVELCTANDMSTTQLLEKREEIAASIENVNVAPDSKANGQAKTALMEQLQIKRDSRIGVEESDKLLVSAMQADTGLEDYLYRPPINQCTLNFLSNRLEGEYRNHYIEDTQPKEANLALPRFSALADMIVSFLFFLMISLCCFLGFGVSVPWMIVFVFALLVEMAMLLPVICDICIVASFSPTLAKIGRFLSSWWPRHMFGCVIASLPSLAVYANFSCRMFDDVPYSDVFYCLVLVASLLHFCNFTMLSSWMKSTLASLVGLVLLILIVIGVCMANLWGAPLADNGFDLLNVTTMAPEALNGTTLPRIFSGKHPLKHEIILNMALLLFLIWFLNREFEISYRLCFHGDKQAVIDKQKMAQEKDQADWLLHNIIPKHVAEVLKQTSQYCRNHQDVGVIFAKVSNFDDFYDESFEGGKEYLRVLNEMMGDFEDLFDDPKYKDVEKIKTIGSCLMAASGLNPTTRNENKDPDAHLYALIDFSLDLLGKLEQFNAEIFNFDFEMAIGYNFGEVTSGVIGTTKLLYDIWGDTVNISSRMYSTGVKGKIQVTEDTAKKLEKMFDFEYRGKIFVKGKGDMNTYILVGKKPDAKWE